ncbi:conserved hypothetical protein [Vibrio crassostreae]|nr:conserved hypothetical protein [Vibrio crassostreae]CAK2819937.1 conserved hypothetical protein [Vibrio crassostreae]CAK2824075.1 conserved hypothetical protein [Vibrio crassostreae]CAK2825836.1 conserved hypothetical protein [Vibrio crassostreae]CAK2918621.1 conserved hypothetical protein [Vibrio crassostreae]
MNPQIFLSWLRYAIEHVGNGYFGHVERVYCYELYHKIRVAMYGYERHHGPIEGLFLHSELVKVIIDDDIARHFDVLPLDGLRIPDFIFHEPGNFDNQIAAIEVKTTPRLSYRELIDDLQKLSQLRVNYQFQLVVFHCLNIDINRIEYLLQRAVDEGVDLDTNIRIIVKPDFGVQLQEMTVGQLLERIT